MHGQRRRLRRRLRRLRLFFWLLGAHDAIVPAP